MKTNPKPTSNSFLAALQRHRGGKALEDASDRLAEVVAAVMESGKPGAVTLTLTVKQASRGQSAVTLTDKITAKVPVAVEPDSFWFATQDGALSKDDPRQAEMQFAPTTIEGGVQEPMTEDEDLRLQSSNP